MYRLAFFLLATLFVFSCSDSEPEYEPGSDMPDNEFTYKGVVYTVSEVELTPQPLQSEEGNEVSIFLLWGDSADGQRLRFDMVINSQGPGLAAGTYPYKLYTTDPGYVRWGSVVVYSDKYDDEQLVGGELEVYDHRENRILIFEGITNKSNGITGKFKGEL